MLEILKFTCSGFVPFIATFFLLYCGVHLLVNILVILLKYISIMIKGYPENHSDNKIEDDFLGL
jgi:uncharacterized membrane protein YqaE (UPF0057 family)